jgi:hypothetical protein
MSVKAAAILENLQQSLDASNAFECVSIGPGMSNRFPRAELAFKGVDPIDRDDSAALRRLRVGLTIYAHCPGMEAIGEVLGLAETARRSLSADPFRGGLCRHVSGGAATELGPVLLEAPCRPPLVALTTEIRCHFED